MHRKGRRGDVGGGGGEPKAEQWVGGREDGELFRGHSFSLGG